MNLVTLVSVKRGKILDGKDGKTLSVDSLFSQIVKDSLLYVLDYDGIICNNPNLELYQRLTEHCVLWIDDGPRRLDDVMDTITAGATNITLRQELWSSLDMQSVQEITDDEIYLDMSKQHENHRPLYHSFSADIGIVLFNGESMYESISKDITTKYKFYLYAASTNKIQFWEQQGITGILHDLKKKEEHNEL